MSFTFKILRDKRRPLKNNEFPLVVRLYQGTKSKELSIGIKLPAKDWDDDIQKVLSSNEHYELFNTKLDEIKAKINRLILLSNLEDRLMPLEDVLKIVFPNAKAVEKADAIKVSITAILGQCKRRIWGQLFR